MSNYTVLTNWVGLDSLLDTDPNKVISGSVFETEFVTIQTAINSKQDELVIKDEDDFISDSATAVASQQSIKAYVDNSIAPAYTSAETAWIGDTAITVSHGLSRVPYFWRVSLRCLTDNNGYIAGDELDATTAIDGDASRGSTTYANATSISYFTDIAAIQNTVADYVVPTSTDWALIFRAW
jgi:hypothetical protein